MEAVTVRGALELLDRAGRVEQRVTLGDRPLRIGRAFDNDLVIDDIHADAHHAEVAIGEDGVPLVRDLGSVNGLRRVRTRGRVESLRLDRECTFHIGAAVLRFRPADYAPAQPLRQAGVLAHPLLWAAIALPAALAVTAFEGSLGSSERVGALQWLNSMLMPLIAMLIWSALWALVGRVLVHHARYFGHVAVVSVGVFVATALSLLLELLAFSLSLDDFAGWVGTLTQVVMLAIVFGGHLRLATRLRWRGAAIAGLCAAVLLAGSFRMAYLIMMQHYSPAPRTAVNLAPPSWRLRAPASTEAFYAHTQTLVDELRDEPPLKKN